MSARSESFAEMRARIEPALRAIVAQYEQRRSALLPIVHRFQQEEGYVSPEAIAATAALVGVPVAVVESTVSFYTLFFRRPVGKYMLQVCRNLSCTLNGAGAIMAYFHEKLGIGHLETTADGQFSYEEVECLAACDRAPCMQVNLEYAYDLTPAAVDVMVTAMRGGTYAVKPLAQTRPPGHSWHLEKDGVSKVASAQGVVDPNAPGGIGDKTGVIMLDRIVHEESLQARSHERLLRDGAERLEHGIAERRR